MEIGRPPTEIIDKVSVRRFASFYLKNIEEIKEVSDESLTAYCNQFEFTRAEYDAYKRGVASFPQFLMTCHAETERLDKELEKELKELEKELKEQERKNK